MPVMQAHVYCAIWITVNRVETRSLVYVFLSKPSLRSRCGEATLPFLPGTTVLARDVVLPRGAQLSKKLVFYKIEKDNCLGQLLGASSTN